MYDGDCRAFHIILPNDLEVDWASPGTANLFRMCPKDLDTTPPFPASPFPDCLVCMNVAKCKRTSAGTGETSVIVNVVIIGSK